MLLDSFFDQRISEILFAAKKSNHNYNDIFEKTYEKYSAILQLVNTLKNEQVKELLEDYEADMYLLLAKASKITYRAGLKDAQKIKKELFITN